MLNLLEILVKTTLCKHIISPPPPQRKFLATSLPEVKGCDLIYNDISMKTAAIILLL